MNHYMIYVSRAHDLLIDQWVVAPNEPAPTGQHPPHHGILRQMKPGDRIWYFRADTKISALISLCEIVDGFTRSEPHKAFPEKHPRAFCWPVRRLARLAPPVQRERLFELSEVTGWRHAPFDVNGKFKPGRANAHMLPTKTIEALLDETEATDMVEGFTSLRQIAFPPPAA